MCRGSETRSPPQPSAPRVAVQQEPRAGLDWDHQQARQKHVGKTGEWLHGSDELACWLLEPGGFLWLHGITGSGKTVLSSTVVDSLRGLSPETNYVAGYYFSAREDEKRIVSRLLRSLLLQLCPAAGEFPPKVEAIYNKCLSQEFSDDQLFGGLEELLGRTGHTYIVIDALDECDATFRSGEKSEAEKLANFLLWLAEKAPNLHLLVTSRDGALAGHVKKALDGLVESRREKGLYHHIFDLEARQTKDKVEGDIGEFIGFELTRWNEREGERRWVPLNKVRQDLIAKSVSERASGMFRLAACLLDLLWGKDGWDELELALADLPPELPDVYDRIFKDIKARGQMETASILLRWILYSERPLSLRELTEVTMADSQGTSFDVGRRAEDGRYVSMTLSSFVAVSAENLVQFAHQSVKDYLILPTTEDGRFAREPDSHSFVTRCCLSYMQFCDQSGLECRSDCHGDDQCCPKEYTLLEYVFNNWFRHAHAAIWREPATNSDVGDTPQPASEMGNGPRSLWEWAASVKRWHDQVVAGRRGAQYNDTLKTLACEGYERFVQLLSSTGEAPYPGKILSSQILATALGGSYHHMIQYMLRDTKTRRLRETKTRELRDTKTRGEMDDSWWPPGWDSTDTAHVTTRKSHEEIVRLLLESGADPGRGDFKGWTALHTAAFQGSETIMRLLMERGPDVDIQDGNGRTALHTAASQGHDAIAQMLLREGADSGAKDRAGWTPLHFAVHKAVETFYPQSKLGSGSRTMTPQGFRSSPEAISRTMALLSESMPSAKVNDDKETPRAISEGPNQLFMGSRVTSVEVYGDACRIAASEAESITLHGGTARFLVHSVARLELFGGYIRFGMSLVEELLAYGQFNPFRSTRPAGTWRLYRSLADSAPTRFMNIAIHDGSAVFSTATWIADMEVYGGSATFLTQSQIGDLSVHAGSAVFSTTAHIGTINVHAGSITLSGKAQIDEVALFEGSIVFSAAAQIRKVTIYGGSAIFSAAAQVENMEMYSGCALLSATARITNLEVHSGFVDMCAAAQITALSVYGGTVNFTYEIQKEIIMLLREEDDADADAEQQRGSDMTRIRRLEIFGGRFNLSTNGRIRELTSEGGIASLLVHTTALKLAVGCGQDAVARLLLEKGADPNATFWPGNKDFQVENSVLDSEGWTPLHQAAVIGAMDMVQLLLEKKADVRIQDSDGHTALQIAASQGHTAIVQLLEQIEREIDRKDKMKGKEQTLLQKAAEGAYNALFCWAANQ